MLFSPNGSLKDFVLKDLQIPCGISKTLIKFNNDLFYGYLYSGSSLEENVVDDFEVIKIFKTKVFPEKYMNMYKYISDKYLYPYSNLLDIVFNFNTIKKPKKKFLDFYIKIDFLNALNFSISNYEDLKDFILQNTEVKYSNLIKNFSKRKVENFLSKINYKKYTKGIDNIQYISFDLLMKKISDIADSKIRLFIFPNSSLKDEFYFNLGSPTNIFNDKNKNFDTAKQNIYFGLPLDLLIPFEWDEIVIVDADNDLYKLNYPPFFDLRDLVKKFFPSSLLHFRGTNFTLYKTFNLNFPNKMERIHFIKSDNSIKTFTDSYYNNFENKRVLFLVSNAFYSTRIKCEKCGKLQLCPSCSTPLAYTGKSYVCPKCGYLTNNLKCDNCGFDSFKYFSFGTEYFKSKLSPINTDISIFDKNNKVLDNLNSQIVVATNSIFYHYINLSFNCIVINNIDEFTFMDYKARDRILNLIMKLFTFLSSDGQILVFYKSNIFNLQSPINFEKYYEIEEVERKNFKFPPYYNIIYVIFDTSQLKLDYLFGKLTLFLRQYNVKDYELFKREEFGRGALTIKINDAGLKMLKLFFDSYKDKVKMYVNTMRDIQ